MIIQKQPNNWSCLPTAFAICIGKDIKFLLKIIGHDGSDISWEQYPEPYNRRGFHIQEIIYAIYDLGFVTTPFEPLSALGNPCKHDDIIRIKNKDFKEVLENSYGVITGIIGPGLRHAIAWDGVQCYDSGKSNITDIEKINIDTFWKVTYAL